jgi:hypothetical protein
MNEVPRSCGNAGRDPLVLGALAGHEVAQLRRRFHITLASAQLERLASSAGFPAKMDYVAG